MALVVANDTTVLQKLTASNLALSTLVTTLTMGNKKLAEALAKTKVASPLAATLGASQCGPPTCFSLATTVGCMAIDAASIT